MGTAFKRRTPLSLATALGIETAPRESDGLRIGAASGSGAGAEREHSTPTPIPRDVTRNT